MGQYYQSVIGSERGWSKKVYYPLDFDNGLKLMEHSYIDTEFMKKIHSILYKNPRRVLWVGDYANEKGDVFYSKSNRNLETPPRSIPVYNFVWGRNRSRNTDIEPGSVVDYENSFLVNHTPRGYLDMKKYCNVSKYNTWGIIDPLPILTVVGNGRGGGDYSGTNENRIGSWKWHLISIEDSPPDGYSEFKARNYSFVEGP